MRLLPIIEEAKHDVIKYATWFVLFEHAFLVIISIFLFFIGVAKAPSEIWSVSGFLLWGILGFVSLSEALGWIRLWHLLSVFTITGYVGLVGSAFALALFLGSLSSAVVIFSQGALFLALRYIAITGFGGFR